MDLMFHYTDTAGYKAIGAAPTWRFRESDPPAEHHPVGAYFTDYDENTPDLANKLRIPRRKVTFVFGFRHAGDLHPIRGDRGRHIFFSAVEYTVEEGRQVRHGATGL
jgi:hypothetical protein